MKTIIQILKFAWLPLLFLTFTGQDIFAGGDLVRITNLKGTWKFNIGIEEAWINPDYNDAGWDNIKVPGAWENQGFHGFDGYGTYRKEFTIPTKHKGRNLYIYLGYIDDVDASYLNGHKIGSTGMFPPEYQSAYNARRLYILPEKYLNYDGENVITVQVFDSFQWGGIVSGDIGIYYNPKEIPLSINLQGLWKFRTGDKLEWKAPKYGDQNWEELFVPGKWENQGFREYDGYAWYRTNFYYEAQLEDSKIVLLLGKIDDVDEVYVNGLWVGKTGNLTDEENKKIDTKKHFSENRAYIMDASLLRINALNTISVRVYDSGGEGGIYQGPVGFVSYKEYVSFFNK